MKDLLSIHDISLYQFHTLMDLSRELKRNARKFRQHMQNRILAVLFKNSLFEIKTGFEAGWLQMDGKIIHISYADISADMQKDSWSIGKHLEKWADAIITVDLGHGFISELARACSIPVINGKSDLFYPCQALAEILTLKEKKGDLAHAKLSYMDSDISHCHSLILASAKTGMEVTVLISESFDPGAEIIEKAREDGAGSGFRLILTEDPVQAVKNADVIYLPVNFRESKKGEQRNSLPQKSGSIVSLAEPDALIMCGSPWKGTPKNKNEKIDSTRSIMLEVADNKLHVQKAIMILLLLDK
ncbi:MAG: hypothetical protein JW755_08285 [Candidatus Aminicenantes bacterium]|nr:hypothetical protein [Candidatus Aminicenantes bacterium]